MRISDWSSDVCSSDLTTQPIAAPDKVRQEPLAGPVGECVQWCRFTRRHVPAQVIVELRLVVDRGFSARLLLLPLGGQGCACGPRCYGQQHGQQRSEEHTSELQSLMRISYAVFCLKKKKTTQLTTLISKN